MTSDDRPSGPPTPASRQRAAPAEPRTKGWVVARLAGAPVIITPSWFVAAIALTLLYANTVGAGRPWLGTTSVYGVALAFVLLLFASVFLHEVAHAYVARARGHEVRELALTLWGGHTAYTGGVGRPLDAFLVAVVGPATNLVLAGAFWGVFQTTDPWGVPAMLLYAGAFSNLFVGVFNLLPGLPLDGGQVLESGVWAVTGDRARGTVAAGWIGRVVAVGIVAWAVLPRLSRGEDIDLTTVVWSTLIAAFLWSGATQAVRQGRARMAIATLAVTDLMVPAVTVPVTATVEDARRSVVSTHAMVVVDAAGTAVAVVEPTALSAVPVDQASRTPLSATSIPLPPGPGVPVTARGADVLDAVADRGGDAPVVPVTDGVRVVGVLPVGAVVQAVRAVTEGRRA
ncbi:site-2 protease family protein [Luteimicrobium subarcticum]|uniref:site-2 protease family protein n=1 Tax=Luteimicrobium subarcticum TaxID=620910 RepID=UPI0012FDDE7B|nr:site-2 protease family protein [Luteimicrobium subarcticum]